MDTTIKSNSCIEDIVLSLRKELKSINEVILQSDPNAGTEDEAYIEKFARKFLSRLSSKELLEIHEKECDFFASYLRHSLSKTIAIHLYELTGLVIYDTKIYEAYMMNYTITELLQIFNDENRDLLQRISFHLHGKYGRNCAVSMSYVKDTKYPS